MSVGHVEPGGDALEIRLSDSVTLTKFSVDPMDNNVYLIEDAAGCVLIDAANDAPRIREVLRGRSVTTIVTTHRHHDHIQALAEMAKETGAALHCGAPDKEAIDSATGTDSTPVWSGDTVALPGGDKLAVIGVVGHTPGAITLAYTPEQGPVRLFTGDSLFPGGPGKTWSEEDFATLIDDLENKLFAAYADDAVVHPGHGDDTTLGAERPSLGEWRERGW